MLTPEKNNMLLQKFAILVQKTNFFAKCFILTIRALMCTGIC